MNYNILVLAYLGDAIYEIYIRKYLISKNIQKVDLLQKQASLYVSAKGQRLYLEEMLRSGFFNEEEVSIIKRGRNHKGTRHPKNTNLITYKYATGLEALLGYLYLNQNKERIDEIMNFIITRI